MPLLPLQLMHLLLTVAHCVSCAVLPPSAAAGQQAGALLLGVVNVVGVITLSTLLADPISKLALYRQGLGFVLGLLPFLQTYAAAFFGIPLVRLLVDGRRNAKIDERNDSRLQVGLVYGAVSLIFSVVLAGLL